ncbi:MAG: nickel-dependent hydrogenase large subunit [Syntrophaceticus schinkii]|jgi:hydrogenase large subunit
MQTISVDPVTRIEGHLKIEVEVDGGKVVSAQSSGTLFRGIELILQGHDPRDAQELVQRICGVCPVGHATASAFALDDAFGIEPPDNGRILRNLILGANYIQSDILHFYHLAALDYVKAPDTILPLAPRYEGDYRLPDDINAAAVDHYLKALEMRKKAHELCAIFGGRAPAPRSIVPGGVTEVVDAEKILHFKYRLAELIDFIDNIYVPDVLAVADVYKDWLDIGRGCQNMLSFGCYPQKDGSRFIKEGTYIDGKDSRFDPDQVTEDVKYSWYKDDIDKSPKEAVVAPDHEKANAYSWMKAPRYEGKVLEVGPLARMWVDKDPTIRGFGEKAFSVMGRHAARALELQKIAHAMNDWVMELKPGEPTCAPHELPKEATGVGTVDAVRGALGHWIKIEGGRIAKYNCVVPTTWNTSPRDDKDQPGPVEQALVGTEVKDANNPIELVRIVRSFDPCIACAVHVITPNRNVGAFRVY